LRIQEVDLTRAFGAAKKAGVDVSVEIDLRHNRMRIIPLKADETGNQNEWDEIFSATDQAQAR
jgi:hypothetical protein